ncbi:MAG: peptide deformylase [Burkholderiales bacterium]|nr:peptide deformylase [Burkholderiales bacterium]
MIKPVLKMGHPLLLNRADELKECEFNTTELKELIQDLQDTQHHHGGIGIAAPQIGVSKRILLIEFYQKDITRYDDMGDCPLKVIINPEINHIGSTESVFNEGCLSVPGLRGEVSRPISIAYKYYDEFGVLHEGQDDGIFARVLQHEIDHLDGILYPMRMQDISKLAFVDAVPSE